MKRNAIMTPEKLEKANKIQESIKKLEKLIDKLNETDRASSIEFKNTSFYEVATLSAGSIYHPQAIKLTDNRVRDFVKLLISDYKDVIEALKEDLMYIAYEDTEE